MTVTRDQERWALALWVEKKHGGRGYEYIQGRIVHFAREGEDEAVRLWEDIAARFEILDLAKDREPN